MTDPKMITFQLLPGEIIYKIISHLSLFSLVSLSQTSQTLRFHAEHDLLWARLVKENVPNHPREFSPSPFKTWKELYLSHHPYWFIPRHKIWFSGSTMTGSIVVARYDPLRACIEGYRLDVERGAQTSEVWEWDPDVVINTFNPNIHLMLDDPVIKLDPTPISIRGNSNWEAWMQTGAGEGIRSTISLCQAIPEPLQDPSMALWPPAILPATQRVRNESQSMFRGNMPRSLSKASDSHFRIRRWLEYGRPLATIMGHGVTTFGTLPQESYTPTKKKPWQGIWVGDYSAHGCEFIVVLQRSVDSGKQITTSKGSSQSSLVTAVSTTLDPHNIQNKTLGTSSSTIDDDPDTLSSEENTEEPEDGSCYGRLEAIKLTGDINVPRGEFTWIAEDIGPRGLIRVAHEQMFKGARVVRSLGHIAAREFRNDRYIASQLIMISHDSLAQYWEDFGHISFYSRVNIDDYLGS